MLGLQQDRAPLLGLGGVQLGLRTPLTAPTAQVPSARQQQALRWSDPRLGAAFPTCQDRVCFPRDVRVGQEPRRRADLCAWTRLARGLFPHGELDI